MHITRRSALASVIALTACSGSSPAVTDAQIITDTQNLVTTVHAIVVALVTDDPKALTPSQQAQLAMLESSTDAALSSLSASMPVAQAATALQKIDDYLNAALSAIGAALPAASAAYPALAPFVPMYDAAVALVETVLEPYINSLVPTTAIKPAARKSLRVLKTHYTAPQARKIIGEK